MHAVADLQQLWAFYCTSPQLKSTSRLMKASTQRRGNWYQLTQQNDHQILRRFQSQCDTASQGSPAPPHAGC
jgi:hypothetical protein